MEEGDDSSLTALDPPLLVGSLPERVVLPILGGTRDVRLSYQTFRHIVERRENERPEHIALVLGRMTEVIEKPTHLGCLSGDPRKLDIFAWTDGDFAGVVVCLKCLNGESWVNTAHPIGRKKLRKHVETGKLRPFGDEGVDRLPLWS